MGRKEHFGPTDVAVYFGEPGKRVPDPYFDGKGPERTGCTFCGACMTGCRVGAKNTLDQNYLYLAERLGAEILAETEATAVRPREGGGYDVEVAKGLGTFKQHETLSADRVIFAGGVLGTVDLLLKMKDDPKGLPNLSPRTGELVRTNSESLIAVVTRRRDLDLSKGVAIGSILHTDEHSHVEPVRYGAGSGFFRLLLAPHAPGDTLPQRLGRALSTFAKSPVKMLKAWLVPDLAKYSQILLYMRSLEGTLSFRRRRGVRTGFAEGLATELSPGATPPARVHPGGDRARRTLRREDRRHRRQHDHRDGAGHPVDRAHPRRRLHRQDGGRRRDRRRPQGLRLSGPLRGRRLGDLGEPGSEPVALDHRLGRARDVARPGEGGGVVGDRSAGIGQPRARRATTIALWARWASMPGPTARVRW